jgi:putative isomerase
MRVHRLAPDEQLLRDGYEAFRRYEAFWMSQRGGQAEGLFHYSSSNPDTAKRAQEAGYESGWDNSVRWDCGVEQLWPIDLNCYMVMLYRGMAAAAEELRRPDEAGHWTGRAGELAERIERVFWDDARGAYCDVYRATGKSTGVLSPASFMPVYVRAASAQRAAAMARMAADTRAFFPGMPTVSYDNPQYRGDQYWRGPTWLNVAWFALKGLKEYGHAQAAEEIRQTILTWCDRNRDTLWEYYDSRTGKGLGAPQFGWTAAFVIEFILDF